MKRLKIIDRPSTVTIHAFLLIVLGGSFSAWSAFAQPNTLPRLSENTLSKVISLPGNQVEKSGLFVGDWHAINNAFLTNRLEFAPFKTALVLWDTGTGRIKAISLQLSVEGRPSHDDDPYFTAEEALTKKFGPSDIDNLNVSLLAKDEAEWQLARNGVFLRRTPHRDGQRETIDYELGVVAKEADNVAKPIKGAFGFTLGATMAQDLVRAGQRQQAGGVIVGVRAPRPHSLMTEYALGLTPQSGKIYSIHGIFSGDGAKASEVFKDVLKEARTSYDWDSCEFEKSSSIETVRLEKADRSIVVAFRMDGATGSASTSLRFVDGKISDQAVLEAKGF